MATKIKTESAADGTSGRVARNASVYFIGQLVSWAVSFTAIAIIPRTLGEKAMGQLALANNAVHPVASLLKCGIETYLVKETGRDRTQTRHLLAATLALRLVAMILLTLLSLFTLWATRADATIWLLGVLTIASCAIGFLAEPLRSILAGWEHAKKVSLADLIATAAPLFAIPFLRYGPVSLAVAATAVTWVGLIIRWAWVRRYVRVGLLFDLRRWAQIVRGGMPFMANSIVRLFYGPTSVFLLRYFTNEATVGVHSQSIRLLGTLLFIPTALAFALLPSLARMAEADPQRLQATQNRVLCLMIILGLPVTTLVILLAEPFCRLLYGNKFLALPLVLQTRALALIPIYIVTTQYQFLVARNKNGIWSLFLMGTVGLNALFCLILIPLALRMGYTGAVGTAGAQFLAEFCTVIFALSLLKANPLTTETRGRVGRAALATAGMGLVVWLLRQSLAGVSMGAGVPRWLTLALMVVLPALAGLAVFSALAWMLRVLTPEEQTRIVNLLQKKFRRGRAQGSS